MKLFLKSISIFIFFILQLCWAQKPPTNKFLVKSAWPTYHLNSARQSSTENEGPISAEGLDVEVISSIKGGTSCWTNISEPYPDGSKVLYQSNATHVHKGMDDKDGFRQVASLRIDHDIFASFGWNFLLLPNHEWLTYDPKYNPKKGKTTKLFKLADAIKDDPRSKIVVKDTFDFGNYGIEKVQHYGINYSGQIIFVSGGPKNKESPFSSTGIISTDFNLLDHLKIKVLSGEIFGHNAFPIEDNNSYYILTTHRLIKINWDQEKLSIDWETKYDFVNDGPTGRWAEGSGTTPTLMGFEKGKDKLIIMADGHNKNNLVAFWREIPEDWKGLPGEDIRLAGKIQLPAAERFSNRFQSIENSPIVYGYDVAIAQFNGFLGQPKKTKKGVQKLKWNQDQNKFEIVWVNKEINMNGVLTYSHGSDLLYGSGKEDDCNYFYYALDWKTGEIKWKKFLGKSCKKFRNPYDDGGNANIIDEDGTIYYAGWGSLVKIGKKKTQ